LAPKPKIYLLPVVAVAAATTQSAVAQVAEQQVKMQRFVPQIVSMEKVQLKPQVVLEDIR
jgi:hypothetical protein